MTKEREHLLERCYLELYASIHDEREHKRQDALDAARAIAERIAVLDFQRRKGQRMTPMTKPEMYELHGLLHQLWSKSGTTAYDKQEWKRLDALIGKAICTILGPDSDRGYMSLISSDRKEQV